MPAADWVYLPDAASGAHYYADLATGTTCWERPPALDEVPTSSDNKPSRATRRRSTAKWVEYLDEVQGLPYYYNELTGESVWVLPADEDDDEEADEEEATEAAEEWARREKAARHRERILDEIITTEQTYVAALQTLMKVYLDPLRAVADLPAGKGQIFTHDDLDAIFLNIEVITKVNTKFLAELQSGAPATEAITAAAKQFKGCYLRYVNNYDAAEAKLRNIRESTGAAEREKNRYLINATGHPDARGKDVTSFLIQPVQRVLRYRLCAQGRRRRPPSARHSTLFSGARATCRLLARIQPAKRTRAQAARRHAQTYGGGPPRRVCRARGVRSRV